MSTFPRRVRLLSGEPDSRRALGMETWRLVASAPACAQCRGLPRRGEGPEAASRCPRRTLHRVLSPASRGGQTDVSGRGELASAAGCPSAHQPRGPGCPASSASAVFSPCLPTTWVPARLLQRLAIVSPGGEEAFAPAGRGQIARFRPWDSLKILFLNVACWTCSVCDQAAARGRDMREHWRAGRKDVPTRGP